eukprot:591105_1
MNALDALRRFTPAIVASPSTFVSKFDELGGINDLIGSIKAMLDSPHDVGFEIISKHSHIITAIVNMFDAVQMSIKIRCVRILLLLCWWKQSSYTSVLRALQIFATNVGLNQIWPLLINNLDDAKYHGKEWELKLWLCTLINVLTNSPFIDLEDRVYIRRDQCKHFKLLQIFGSLTEECQDIELYSDPSSMDSIYCAKIQKQIQVYTITKDSDDHDKMVESLDLSDVDQLFAMIKKGAAQYGYTEQLTRILQNFILIPNHQRSLRQHVWQNCNKAINICCNPLREQYLIDAEEEAKQEDNMPKQADTITVPHQEEEKDHEPSVSIDIDSDSEEDLLEVVDEYDEEEDDVLYKERLITLPFVLDLGFEDKDGFDFYICDPNMSLTMDEKQDKNNKKLTQKWCRASFIFENLSDPNNTKITFDLNKTSNVLRIKQESDDADAVKERSYALKGKKSTLNVNELSASSDPSQTASISSTNQAMNRRQSGKDVAVTIEDEHIIGDHITIAISSKGMNFFWEENRSAAYHIALDVSNSWLISFSGDEYASIAQSQFFSCSLLKQFPTFMELNLYLSKLPDFEDKELELENKLKETEQQVTKFKEISENRATKLKTAAATAIALRDKLKETQCVAARMHQDIQLIKQVAPKAFDRVAMHHKGVKLEPEPQNVMISQSKTKATTPAAAAASPNAAPIPKKGGAPMPAPLPGAAPLPGGAPMPAPLPGAAPLPAGAAPLPGGAAPIPGGAAPIPGGAAPIPKGAPIPMKLIIMAKKKQQPTIKMTTLHWKPIADKKIPGTIWEDITKMEDDLVELYYPNPKKEEKDKETETEEMQQKEMREKSTLEELFAAKQTKPKKKGGDEIGDQKQKKELIEIIDGKRSYNVSIGLSRFKMKNSDIKMAVLSMDEEVFNIDKLNALIRLAPTPEEVTQMQSYAGSDCDLALCERFFNQFRAMDNVKERLSVWAYKVTFDEEYNEQKRKVDLLSDMATKIKESKGLKRTLASILACGNFINGGTKKGAKHGFELETLSKICAYKTTDSTMDILGYVYTFLEAHYPDSLKWIEEMKLLEDVIRIETDKLHCEIAKMDKDLGKVNALLKEKAEAKNEAIDDRDMFEEVMTPFCKESSARIETLQNYFHVTITKVQDLAKFYGEEVKPSLFKLKDFFGIFNQFRAAFIVSRDKVINSGKDLEKAEENERKQAAIEKKRAEQNELEKETKKTDVTKSKEEQIEEGMLNKIRRRRQQEKKKKRKKKKSKGNQSSGMTNR